MDEAAFRCERLKNAVIRLRQRLKEVERQEEDQRRWIRYEAAKAERDKLAEELVRVYPPIADQLRDLLTRLSQNDKEIELINERALPHDAPRLQAAELIARGLGGFREGGMYDVPRVTQTRLPAFKFDPFERYTWPTRVSE